MRDQTFSGGDVGEALAAAGRALGLDPGALRYVVLDPGSPGGLGIKPTPARIAVLLDGVRQGAAPQPAPQPRGDFQSRIRALVRAVAEAAGLDVSAEIEAGEEGVAVRLLGPDRSFFYGPADRGDALRALEHLLQRILAAELAPRALRLECEGYRERREAALGEEARRLAEQVKGDGVARTTGPLNSYERRIIHLALSEAEGVVTYSVGEGPERRVTVAAAPPVGSREDPTAGNGDAS